ncbi:hypothetical protein ACFL5O_02175 [Myxococcota bacterium]
MTIGLLIRAIVSQTTILIAQLATSGGARAPLVHVANQVFLELVRELERQGVGRKVSADMFGLGLRTYQRKIQRLTESSTDRGRSLWVALLDYLHSRTQATRAQILLHFAGEDETQVRGVLHDLCETGLITVSRTSPAIAYRCTPDDELVRQRQARQSEGLDELLWALIYRQGPLTWEQLAGQCGDQAEMEASLDRLLETGRVERLDEEGAYRTRSLVLPLGSPVGWEASVFDHFKALVATITCRLRADRAPANLTDRVGGSTYTLEVWPGHPLEQEAYATLGVLRSKLGDLRQRIEAHNAERGVPENHTQVLLYVGQCLIRQGSGEPDDIQ